MRAPSFLAFAAIASAWFAAAAPAMADSLPNGTKSILLVTASGEEHAIGTTTFTPDGDGAAVEVKLDAPEFQDEFLSMRPFRCLPDTKEMWCHLAYPYATRSRITAADLADLEYQLLFLFKPPAGYGIDAWNGLYFKLTLQEDGSLTGDVHETDMNVLAVPPEGEFPRPIGHGALTPVDAGTHRFARVVVR